MGIKYCVYLLLKNTNKKLFDRIFYVGISSTFLIRMKSHNSDRCNPIKIRIMKKYGWIGYPIWTNLSIEEAKEREIFLIRYFGRINLKTGQLSNMTDGGDHSSKEPSEEVLKQRKLILEFTLNKTAKEIEKELNLSRTNIRRWTKEFGLSRKIAKIYRTDKEKLDLIRRFKESVLSQYEFAKLNNVDKGTLSGWLKHGI